MDVCKGDTYISEDAFNFFLELEKICIRMSDLDIIRRAREDLVKLTMEKVMKSGNIHIDTLICYTRRRSKRCKHGSNDVYNAKKKKALYTLSIKYVQVRMKAAIRYLMNDMGMGYGSALRGELKVRVCIKKEKEE